jgi:hypothetical protein
VSVLGQYDHDVLEEVELLVRDEKVVAIVILALRLDLAVVADKSRVRPPRMLV